MKGRILIAQEKINLLKNQKFTDKDLRGLSKIEKEFIIENDYYVQIDNQGTFKNETCYMFISRNNIGKKQLYALTKRQSIYPNKQEISANAYNYECWLVLHKGVCSYEFNKYYYERRFCTTPNISMIFA